MSAYVRRGSALARGPKKSAQIRLSNALARALAEELIAELPNLKEKVVTQEQTIAGGLRTAKADVSESHHLDGLRLAVELKPVNLAVGRAIWNRFGDLRTFAVNIHLKFPFAVVGGVLVIPTYEEIGTKAAEEAEAEETDIETGEIQAGTAVHDRSTPETRPQSPVQRLSRKSTVHLIERAIERLIRAGVARAKPKLPTCWKALPFWFTIPIKLSLKLTCPGRVQDSGGKNL